MAGAYEFVCDRIIPGCTHTETAKTKEEARQKAERHMKDHHEMEYLDAGQSTRIDMAIFSLR